MTPFEVFDKRMTPLAKAPSVMIQKRGIISLNKAAHDLIGNAQTVELLYDRDRQVIALRVADDSFPHAYAVRNGSMRGPGQAISRPALSMKTALITSETALVLPPVWVGGKTTDGSDTPRPTRE